MSSNHKKLSYNQGIVYAVGCYVAWGLFPVFWKAITGVPAVNVLALIGVTYFTISYGKFPWISLILATTFGLYGLLKKKANLESMPALTVETMVVFPFALTFLFYTAESNLATPFFPSSTITSSLLIISGLVTAIPLFLFGKSAEVIPLSTMGFIQYLSPTNESAGNHTSLFRFDKAYDFNPTNTKLMDWMEDKGVYEVKSIETNFGYIGLKAVKLVGFEKVVTTK